MRQVRVEKRREEERRGDERRGGERRGEDRRGGERRGERTESERKGEKWQEGREGSVTYSTVPTAKGWTCMSCHTHGPHKTSFTSLSVCEWVCVYARM